MVLTAVTILTEIAKMFPFGNCLPGTELFQTPVGQSLAWDNLCGIIANACSDWLSMMRWLAIVWVQMGQLPVCILLIKHHKTLLNTLKTLRNTHKTWNACKTLWNTCGSNDSQHWCLLQRHQYSQWWYRHSLRQYQRLLRHSQRLRCW